MKYVYVGELTGLIKYYLRVVSLTEEDAMKAMRKEFHKIKKDCADEGYPLPEYKNTFPKAWEACGGYVEKVELDKVIWD